MVFQEYVAVAVGAAVAVTLMRPQSTSHFVCNFRQETVRGASKKAIAWRSLTSSVLRTFGASSVHMSN